MTNRFLLLIIVSILWGSLRIAESRCLARNDRDYDAIVSVITSNFYDRKFKGLDWSSRVAAYRDQISCSPTEDEVAQTVNRLLSELKTSHTSLFTKQDLKYWSLKSIFSLNLQQFEIPFSGIWPQSISGESYVKYVLQGSPAEMAGIKAGDKLLSMDSHPFQSLGFSYERNSVLEISSDGSQEQVVRIMPSMGSMQNHFLKAAQNSRKILTSKEKRVGYVHLWCGTHDHFLREFNSALLDFRREKIDGLIVDLRDGFGGAYPDYLEGLIGDDFFAKLPKVFLINEGVVSGKEWLAAIIKRDRMGRLVGTKTAGAFIQGKAFDLLGGRYLLYLAVAEFNPPNIPKLEGIGVEPDVVVEGCQKFCQGRDPQLDVALEVLLD